MKYWELWGRESGRAFACSLVFIYHSSNISRNGVFLFNLGILRSIPEQASVWKQQASWCHNQQRWQKEEHEKLTSWIQNKANLQIMFSFLLFFSICNWESATMEDWYFSYTRVWCHKALCLRDWFLTKVLEEASLLLFLFFSSLMWNNKLLWKSKMR